jgi:hypothetical protein
MKEVMVKAVPVNGLADFVSNDLPASKLQQVLSKLGEEAKFFSGHLLAHDQVPLTAVNRFTTFAAIEKGEPVKQFARRAGRYGADLGLKTVYKFIMLMMSVESVLKKAPFMWTRVYDSGRMDVESSKGQAKIHVHDFIGDPAGCGRITGWFEVIGERAGAKNLRVAHSKCMAEAADECLWDFRWDE